MNEYKLTDEELASLVEYFELLIEIDKEQKASILELRDENKSNRH